MAAQLVSELHLWEMLPGSFSGHSSSLGWHRDDVLAFQSSKDLPGADPLFSWTSWAVPRDPVEE